MRPGFPKDLEAILEYLKQLETVLTILLGWLLGLLTPGIAERIRRPYRRRESIRAVVDEMLSLQHTMAIVAYQMRAMRAEVSDSFLDGVLPVIERPGTVTNCTINRRGRERESCWTPKFELG